MSQAKDKTYCGFIALIGEPNVGKSSLLNQLLGEKIGIVTPKVQTTRFPIKGIKNIDNSQLIFLDTPGIFKATKEFDEAMVESARTAAADADLVVVLVDAKAGLKSYSLDLINQIPEKKRLVAISKVDLVVKDHLLPLIDKISTQTNPQHIFATSAEKGDGTAAMMKTLASMVPEGPWAFEGDDHTDISARLWAAEITREKLFRKLRHEIPYGLHVETESWEEFRNGSVKITQVILIEREAHKPIILGKGGEFIKRVNQEARADIAASLGVDIHLFLHVKVDSEWMNRPEIYKSLGLQKTSAGKKKK